MDNFMAAQITLSVLILKAYSVLKQIFPEILAKMSKTINASPPQ